MSKWIRVPGFVIVVLRWCECRSLQHLSDVLAAGVNKQHTLPSQMLHS